MSFLTPPVDPFDYSALDKAEVAKNFREYCVRNANKFKAHSYQDAIVPCMDTEDALFRYALSRKLDFENAAARFYKFNQILKKYDVTTFDAIDDEIALGFASGCWYEYPRPDAFGRPIFIVFSHLVDWKKMTVRALQRASLFYCWRMCLQHGYTAQTIGVLGAFCAKSFSTGLIKMEFESFISKVMQEALPMKIGGFMLIDEPGWARNIIRPLMNLLLKAKLRQRVVWAGSTTKPLNKKDPNSPMQAEVYLRKVFGEDRSLYPPQCMGTREYDPRQEFARLCEEYHYTPSDALKVYLPGGGAPVPVEREHSEKEEVS